MTYQKLPPMRNLFEPDARKEVLERLDKITPDSKAKWGQMSVDQMLWHCNRTMSYSMGEYQIPFKGNIITKLVFKPMVLGKMQFPKGRARTIEEWKAIGNYHLEAEKKRFREYVERHGKSQHKIQWPHSPLLGKFTGENWARINYKHIDHHFTQFGA
jgi:hypothetical protein